MGQPPFIQKTDGSSAAASSLTLTPGGATTAANAILVGVVLNANGADSQQTVGGITDSAGSVSGVPVNNWVSLGNSSDDGIRMEWWIAKGTASITSLVIHLTGTQSIVAVMLEYSGVNGMTLPIFQAILASQNQIASNHIRVTASTYPNSGAELMIGLFSMLSDTFNSSASAPPGESVTEVVRSTNSLSIPPALSYQVIENGTVDGTGLLNVNAVSATELATPTNVAASSMQCLFILISGGLIINTQPGFSDQPDSALAAGQRAIGLALAKINGNAELGMCRLEFFQGVYTNGQTVGLPVSPVDGYEYSRSELIYIWAIYNSANPSSGWITGPTSLWYCGWNVDQETGDVLCDEWYRNAASSGDSADGSLQVFTIAQRQQNTLELSAAPTWSQQQASSFVSDLAYSQDVMQTMNENAKFAVVGQEVISMGEFYNGQTVPRPVSPADAYLYAYSEVKFVFSWRWTCGQSAYAPPAWEPQEGLGALYASIGSTGAVTCGIGWSEHDGNNYSYDSTSGRLAVFALCARARTGSPSSPASQFAEIPNSLFYPGNPLPASLGAQLVNNINEAALSPEFFGPTLYEPGDTIPTPTSSVDGYAYQRSELIYIWEWHVMDTGSLGDDPRSYGGSTHVRTPLFSAAINQSTGVVSTNIWHLAPGGPYSDHVNSSGAISVVVVGFRASEQSAVSSAPVQAPSDSTSRTADSVGTGGILTLQVDSTDASSQVTQNLIAGSNVTLTDLGGGDIKIDASGGGGGGSNDDISYYLSPATIVPPSFTGWLYRLNATYGFNANGAMVLTTHNSVNPEIVGASILNEDFTIIGCFATNPPVVGSKLVTYGINLVDTGSGKIVSLQVNMATGSNPVLEVDHYPSFTGSPSIPFSVANPCAWGAGPTWLRIDCGRGLYTFYVSVDGQSWDQCYQESTTAYLATAANEAGFAIFNNATTPQNVVVPHFQVTSFSGS